MSFEKKLNHGESLFHAALTEFIAHGYAAASLNHILSTAGMSKGQFYYHFGNKKGLYFALIDVMKKTKAVFWEQHKAKKTSKDFFERFGKELEIIRRFTQEHPEIQRFSEALLKEKGNPIFDEAVLEKNITDDSHIHSLIAQSYQDGVFRKDISLEFIQNILSYLSIHLSEMFDLDQSAGFAMHLEPLLKLLDTGLGAKSSETPESEQKTQKKQSAPKKDTKKDTKKDKNKEKNKKSSKKIKKSKK